MQIININSSIDISFSQKFIEEVLLYGEEHHHMEKNSLHILSENIPIFLLNEESMKKYDTQIERYEYNTDFKPDTESLGFYGRDNTGLFERTPRIALCPERIAQCVANDEEFVFLLAKVTVHEYAHAKMDFENQNRQYRRKDEFWTWMEESSANRYTLEIFKNFTNNYRYTHNRRSSPFRNQNWEHALFDFVVDFVKKQPPEYALGYELFDKSPISESKWEREKANLGGSQRVNEKKEWLDYMKNNYSNIDKEHSDFLYDCVFNGKNEATSKLAKEKLSKKIKDNAKINPKDLENVTDMSYLFHGIRNFSQDISGWDVSKVTKMGDMFRKSTFNPDISKWNTKNVTDMADMFNDASFNQDISSWNVEKVKSFSSMLQYKNIKVNDRASWDEYVKLRKKEQC